MANNIVQLAVSQQIAPTPLTLQKSGAIVSQGATNQSQFAYTLLTQLSDLTPLLNGSKPITTAVFATNIVTYTLTQAVAATVAGAVSFLAQMLSYSMWFGGGSRDNERGGNPLGVLATVIFAPMAATIIQLAISRTREFSADAGAAKLTGNPRALARALQRLESTARQIPLNANPAFEPLLIIHPISGQFLGNLFSSHPATEARVEALLQLESQLISR